jgi:hypothetical protein
MTSVVSRNWLNRISFTVTRKIGLREQHHCKGT